jgi:hypothetical protein
MLPAYKYMVKVHMERYRRKCKHLKKYVLVEKIMLRKPQLLSHFIEKKYVVEKRVKLEYYNNDGESIANIEYVPHTGQIGLFIVNDIAHRRRNLGKQMLNKAISDMFHHDVPVVWTIAYENHPFWANVWKKSFTYQNPILSHKSKGGYYMNLY